MPRTTSSAESPTHTDQTLTAMNTQTETNMHALALAQFLNIDPSDVSPMKWDHYGLPQFEADGGEYAVGTDQEAQTAGIEAVRQSLWAFNASFILSECGLPHELEDAISAFASEKCESANDAIEKLVEKCCKNGVEEFAESAFSADGRGRFLSSYNGDEDEETVNGITYFIYRTN